MDFRDDDDAFEEAVERFLRGNAVLIASALLALVSAFLVPPSMDYLGYIDVRTIAVLFCFMAVVAGLRRCNVFKVLAQRVLGGSRGLSSVCLLLVALPYASAMLVTNDVALVTFIPFGIMVLRMAGRHDLIVPVVVLQTAAAILGSMAMPFGNAQNLYVSSHYGVPASDFLSAMLPISLTGMAVVTALSLRFGNQRVEVGFEKVHRIKDRRLLAVCAVLFCLCIATVAGPVPWQATLVITLISMSAAKPEVLGKVDYGLLLTLVFLFIFAGNMAGVGIVRETLVEMMAWDPTVTSLVLSQFMNNVPATVLLSEFTDDWSGLIMGTDIGGLGSPIASMAAVVALRLYMREQRDGPRTYLKHYFLVSLLLIAVLLPAALIVRRGFGGLSSAAPS